MNSSVTVFVKETQSLERCYFEPVICQIHEFLKGTSLLLLLPALCCTNNLDCRVVCMFWHFILFFLSFQISQEIIVKIVTKKLGEKYHKKKAVVKVRWSWGSCGTVLAFLELGDLGRFVSLCRLFSLRTTLLRTEMLPHLYWDLFWTGSEPLNCFKGIYSMIFS